jgi:L-cysteine:1D-myo-inositol 2-amino-2-deoxy-alpha-D-glucopyranoside ligase
MSKSRGNLVLVSRLRHDGVDPAAIRLAILAHHYRSDWFWTDEVLEQAQTRLARWRSALASTPPGSAEILVAGIRAALSQDLDAPRALAAVDLWADEAARRTGHSPEEAALVRDAVEALLGIVVG